MEIRYSLFFELVYDVYVYPSEKLIYLSSNHSVTDMVFFYLCASIV